MVNYLHTCKFYLSKEKEFDSITVSESATVVIWLLVLFFKLADVRCVSHICGLIHQVYADFSEPLKKGLLKMFDGYGGKEEEKVGQPVVSPDN